MGHIEINGAKGMKALKPHIVVLCSNYFLLSQISNLYIKTGLYRVPTSLLAAKLAYKDPSFDIKAL